MHPAHPAPLRTFAALCVALAAAAAHADTQHDCVAGGWQATFVESSGPDGPLRSLRIAYFGGDVAVYGNEQITETPTPLGRLQTVPSFRREGLNTVLVPDVVLFDSTPVAYTSWLYQTVTPPPGDPVRQRNRGLRAACTVRFVLPEGDAR